MYVGGGPTSVRPAIYRAMLQRQDDAELECMRREIELECMRREMWSSYRVLAAWVLGFPLVSFCAAALATATGLIRFH